jgi:hypothetical protein
VPHVGAKLMATGIEYTAMYNSNFSRLELSV